MEAGGTASQPYCAWHLHSDKQKGRKTARFTHNVSNRKSPKSGGKNPPKKVNVVFKWNYSENHERKKVNTRKENQLIMHQTWKMVYTVKLRNNGVFSKWLFQQQWYCNNKDAWVADLIQERGLLYIYFCLCNCFN